MINAKIIADSVSSIGKRITTLQLVYPRIIHGEFMTHRVFSRNASSSRAVPVNRMANMALTEMYEPIRWGKNQKGMQSSLENLEGDVLLEAQKIWRDMANYCAMGSKRLSELGLHKQWANRPTEWFSYIRVLLTSTEFDNFFLLRDHSDAQPEIEELAIQIKEAMNLSSPRELKDGEWHLPYISNDELNDSFFKIESNRYLLQKISSARCCRVSYLNHDGTSPNRDEDMALFMRLAGGDIAHLSPLEHQACPIETNPQWASHRDAWGGQWSGNLEGWLQFRQLYVYEQANSYPQWK